MAPISTLLSIATLGNTLGALTTWGLGSLAAKKYPLESVLSKPKQQAVAWVTKWGYWALLFSWLPVVGDGFCFAGGWLKMPLLPATMTICVGKALRYCAVVYLVLISG
jgi:membrane protein YqaA with SNARE-associated domain